MDNGRQRQDKMTLFVAAAAVVVALGLVIVACTGSGSESEVASDIRTEGTATGGTATDGTAVEGQTTDSRSSGQLDENQTDDPDDAGRSVSDGSGASGQSGDSPSNGTRPVDDQSQPTDGTDGDPGDQSADPSSFVPEDRPDGIEFVYEDGSLGPVELGATIDDIATALGPDYEITAEEQIRVDFSSGYSVARDGEVLFFAIEEDGVITVLMSRNPKVGLDGGLRPKMPLEEAVALHGEPTITFGPEGREFVSFADGVGGDGSLSVLVAIGEFGGPVGVYEAAGPALGEETVAYQPENANVAELWFWAR